MRVADDFKLPLTWSSQPGYDKRLRGRLGDPRTLGAASRVWGKRRADWAKGQDFCCLVLKLRMIAPAQFWRFQSNTRQLFHKVTVDFNRCYMTLTFFLRWLTLLKAIWVSSLALGRSWRSERREQRRKSFLLKHKSLQVQKSLNGFMLTFPP